MIIFGEGILVIGGDEGGGEGQGHEGPEGNFHYGMARLCKWRRY